MLTRRLNGLVEAGLLERRRYSERPPRDERVLTTRGRDFRPVLWALLGRRPSPGCHGVLVLSGACAGGDAAGASLHIPNCPA